MTKSNRVVVLIVMNMDDNQLADFENSTHHDETLIVDWIAKHASGDNFVYLNKVDATLPIEE
jgi:hypothetical protein